MFCPTTKDECAVDGARRSYTPLQHRKPPQLTFFHVGLCFAHWRLVTTFSPENVCDTKTSLAPRTWDFRNQFLMVQLNCSLYLVSTLPSVTSTMTRFMKLLLQRSFCFEPGGHTSCNITEGNNTSCQILNLKNIHFGICTLRHI